MKEVARVLDSYAYKNGQDNIGTFNDWLVWLCNIFNIHSILEHGVEKCSIAQKKKTQRSLKP